MELKNIFKMTKTDRYTQDGRDELAKLQETEDVKYKTGDISQKTGLQKQPDGSWAPPKKGAETKSAEESKINETINAKRAQQKEAEKAEYNRNIRSFYDNTGLKGGPEEVLARKEAEKADRKQENLQPGKRDDSMFKEKDKVEFARHGKYMNGEIESIRKDWKGNVSMQIKGEDGKSYFVEAGDITKHKPSGESKPAEKQEQEINSRYEMEKAAKSITPEEADAFYKNYGLDKTGEHKDRKGWLVKEYKNSKGDIYRAKFDQQNRPVGTEFLPKGSAENPGDESKPAESKPAEGIPIQGTNWLSLPSGTRVTNEGAREKMARNNERIETIKKIMEGRSAANNFRLGAELKSLQNENEWITSRLPPEKPVTQSSDSSPRELTGDCKIRIRK